MRTIKYISFLKMFGIILPILFILISCKVTPPEPSNGSKGNGMLIVEDVGVTDAVLHLRVPGGFKSRNITLKRLPAEQAGDTTTILSRQVTSLDTIVIDEKLLPKHSYKYTLTVEDFLNLRERSYADVVTMDTTSHEFTWQIDTLGDGNSSILRDVAIVNDTCVYAVGEIYKKDSTGQIETTPYNAARWDGRKWNLIRIQFRLDYGTSVIYSYMGIKSLFAVSPEDIWFVHNVGGITRLKDGQWMMMNFKLIDGPGGANKIWGTSSNNLYFVGSVGRIVKYDGNIWQKIESGTDVNLTDVWGSPDGKVVWTCGWEDFKPTVLLKYENGILTKQYEEYSDRFRIREDSLSGVLIGGGVVQRKSMVILSNYGIYKTSWDTRGKGRRIFETYDGFTGFPFSMRANDINDIMIAGTGGYIAHYNGVNFHRYEEATAGNVYFYSADIKKNIAAVVGEIYHPYNGKGIVYIGKR